MLALRLPACLPACLEARIVAARQNKLFPTAQPKNNFFPVVHSDRPGSSCGTQSRLRKDCLPCALPSETPPILQKGSKKDRNKKQKKQKSGSQKDKQVPAPFRIP